MPLCVATLVRKYIQALSSACETRGQGNRLRQLLTQAGKRWVSSGRGARHGQGTKCSVWSCLVAGTTDFRACPRKHFCGEASISCDSFQFESSARPDKDSAPGGGVLGLNTIYTVGSLSPPPTFFSLSPTHTHIPGYLYDSAGALLSPTGRKENRAKHLSVRGLE